jgi:hypothetical protein
MVVFEHLPSLAYGPARQCGLARHNRLARLGGFGSCLVLDTISSGGLDTAHEVTVRGYSRTGAVPAGADFRYTRT